MSIVAKARAFAERAHYGHMRKNDATILYIFHVQEVAELVATSGGDENEISAAWLHDTVEDTPATFEDIRNEFGDEITRIVEGLTDLPEWTQLPLQERKAKQAERITQESDSVKRVKLADQASNVKIVGAGKDNFSVEKKFIYIESAKKIAEACRGVSAMLDREFTECYEVAFESLNELQSAAPNNKT